MSQYDFIVLGGGHNGLISAGYLGKAGFKVCVLEANEEFGGGTRSGEVCAPGYISDLGGMVHSMISRNPLIANDELELQSKYELNYIPVTNLCASIFPDDTCLVIDTDIDKTCENIAQFSEKDADAYRKFNKHITDMLKVARVGTDSPPPTWSLMQSALGSSPEGREFIRVMNCSAQNIVEEWFESEQLRVTLTRWTTEMMINPQAIGTATLLYFIAWVHQMRAPIPEGGAKKMIESLIACCEDKGATLRTNSKVVKVNVASGEAKSVVLEDGEEIFASKGIISTINAKDLYGAI
ncbi:MAG: NAD(P)/FAD-dependent oxidoreductase, partial [Clostridiaceae bacterium]|nr:NAD(P)/FAD-dependent oxidoreductase [Clostridiaceae bacterium]